MAKGRSASARGRQNRKKGNAYATRVAKYLSLALGRSFRRETGETQTGRKNDVREDCDELLEIPYPIVVECRKGRPSVKRAVRDAASYRTDPKHIAAAFLYFDQETPGEGALEIVAFPLDDALRLLSAYDGIDFDTRDRDAKRIRGRLEELRAGG